MRYRLTVCTLLTCCLQAIGSASHAAILASSLFSSGDEGWRSFSLADTANPDFRSALGGDSAVVFDGSNGNIAGSIERTDPDFGWQYFVAPAAFWGNKSTAAGGGTLTFQQQRRDTLVLDLVVPKPPLVGISDGTTVLVYANAAAAPVTNRWTDYLVNFAPDAQGWFVDSLSGLTADSAQLATVLGNLSKLWIVGEWFAGAITDDQPETIALDNVILTGLDVTPAPVPLTGTLWLVLTAGLLLATRVHKQHRHRQSA